VTGFLGSRLLPGDIVITLGAGDIYRVGLELVELLKTTV
jgi:UDP-N-acetylmuramate-alanine ligase